MRNYRLYLIDGTNHITAASIEITAVDDAAAVEAAYDARGDAYAVEIWNGKRLVGAIPWSD